MQVDFNKGTIHYKVEGQGPTIVFLHGFMENARIWRPYLPKLSTKFRVIRINLPGHGKSSVFAEKHSMEFMADALRAVLDNERSERAMLVGHSMGGYVALAFAETYPDRVSGLVLFSSTCFEDTPERKSDRSRAMKVAETHKMKFITSVIPNLFFERSGAKASKRIFKMVRIASKQPKEGITAAIAGMRDRADRSAIIHSAKYPMLFLTGSDDMLIPLERVQEMHRIQPDAEIAVLENCGHLGFIEQEQESLKVIQKFAIEKIL